MLAYVRDLGLRVQWILETHAHADHLSRAQYLQELVGGRIAIGERIKEVQATFKKLYNLERNFLPDGAQFDHLFEDDEVFKIGEVEARALLVLATLRQTWPTWSTARLSWATRCSCPMSARPARASPAATRIRYIVPCVASCLCHRRRRCSSAKTTRPRVGRLVAKIQIHTHQQRGPEFLSGVVLLIMPIARLPRLTSRSALQATMQLPPGK